MNKYIVIVYYTTLYIVCFYTGVVRCKENSSDTEKVPKVESATKEPASISVTLATEVPSPFAQSNLNNLNLTNKVLSAKRRPSTLRRRFLPYRMKSRRYSEWHNYIGAQNAAYESQQRYQHLPPQPFPPQPAPPPGYPADPYAYQAGYPNPQPGYANPVGQQYYEQDPRIGRNPGFDNGYVRRPLPVNRRFKLRRPVRPTEAVPQLNYLEKVSKPGGGFEYRQVKLHHDEKGNVYYSRQGETENGTIVVRRQKNYFKPRSYPYYPDNSPQNPNYPPETAYYQQGYQRPAGYYPQEQQPANPVYPQQPYAQPGYTQTGYAFQQPYPPQYPPQPYPPQPQPQPQPYPPPPHPPHPQPYPQQQPYSQQSYARQPVPFPLGGYVLNDKPGYMTESRATSMKFAKVRAEANRIPTGNPLTRSSTVRTL